MAIHAEASAPSRRDPRAIDTAVRALTAKFGNRVVTSQAVREQHGNTVTWIESQPPDAVVFPQSTEDVQDIVRGSSRSARARRWKVTSTRRSAASRSTSAI